MSQINELCCKLEEGKATERKKSAEKLKSLLSSPESLKKLDEHSSRQDAFASCTWSRVFEAAVGALENELKGQRSCSKKPEMYSLVKLVLEHAKGRYRTDGSPVINLSAIFDHICIMLREYEHILASEYCFILCQYFLNSSLWKHWKDPDMQRLSKLLRTLCKGIAGSIVGYKSLNSARAVYMLSSYLCMRIDIKTPNYLKFLADFVQNFSENSQQILEFILKAINVLAEKGAVGCRYQLAGIGDLLSRKLIHIWYSKASDAVKLQIVTFFNLQMLLHREDNSTAINGTPSNWQDVMWELYKTMYMEVEKTKLPIKTVGGKVPTLWTEEFCYLFSQVCILLIPEGEKFQDVSFMMSQSQHSHMPPAKKRRVESGWSSLMSNINENKDNLNQIAWLRVVCHIVKSLQKTQSESSAVTDYHLMDLIRTLSEILSTSKRNLILAELAHGLTALAQLPQVFQAETVLCWRKITNCAISLVERSHLDYYRLLAVLVEKNKLNDKQQLIRVLKLSVSSPLSAQAITWLQSFICQHELILFKLLNPSELELLFSNTLSTQAKDYWQHLWVANHLLEPVIDDDGIGQVLECSRKVDAEIMSRILANLVSRDVISSKTSQSLCSNQLQKLGSITAMYNSIQFSEGIKELSSTNPQQPNCSKASSYLLDVQRYINGLLIERIDNMKELIGSVDFQNSALADCLWTVELVIHYMDLINIASDSSITLINKTKDFWLSVLRKLENNIRKRDPDGTLVSALLSFSGNLKSDGVVQELSSLPELASLVCKTICGLLDSSKTANSSSWRTGAHNSHTLSAPGDWDGEFVIPDVPAAGASSADSNNEIFTVAIDPADSLLHSLCVISTNIGTSIPVTRSESLDLLRRLKYSSSTSHALISCQLISNAACHWSDVDHKTAAALIFHIRGMVEVYHLDPRIGVTCVELLNQTIQMVNIRSSMSPEHKLECGGKLLYILSGLSMKIFDKRGAEDDRFELVPLFDVSYRISFIQCVVELCKVESVNEWIESSEVLGSPRFDLHVFLIKNLLDRSYRVRKAVIDNIDVLFNVYPETVNALLTRQKQEEVFDKIYEEMHCILVASGNLDEMGRIDEQTTRSASLLSLFQAILLSSPACSRKSLFALFLLHYENQNITIDCIEKVLNQAVATRKSSYESVEELCALSLPYVAKEWVNMEHSLSRFPIKLFGFDNSKVFYKKYVGVFLPLVLKAKNDVQTELCDLIGQSASLLILDCVPEILCDVLPGLTDRAPDAAACKQSEAVLRRCTAAVQEMGLQLWEVAAEKLDKLILLFYMSIWEPSSHFPSEPYPNPPYHTRRQIKAAENYVQHRLQGTNGASSLLERLAKDMSSLSSVLLSLAVYMTSGKHCFELRHRVTIYLLFIDDLLPLLFTTLNSSLQYYIEVISSVLCTTVDWMAIKLDKHPQSSLYIQKSLDKLLKCHQKVIEALLESSNSYSHVLASVVPKLTYTLCGLHGTPCSLAAAQFLSMIWVDHIAKFEYLLHEMIPLPANIFPELLPKNTTPLSLVKLIKFYNEGSGSRRSIQSRSHLLPLILCRYKESPAVLSADSESDISVVSKFIRTLLNNVKSEYVNEKHDITSCLAVIGSRFAHYISSQRSEEALPASDSVAHDDVTILSEVIRYMLDDSLEVIQMCDRVLADIIPSSPDLADKNKHSSNLLFKSMITPYRLGKKSRSITNRIDVKSCLCERLWDFSLKRSFDDWIRDLTQCLTQACGTEMYRALSPLCAVKTKFSELMLPMVIYELLSLQDEKLRQQISKLIEKQLKNAIIQPADDDQSVRVVSSLLSVVQYLRTKDIHVSDRGKIHTSWMNNFWLDVDFGLLAEAAFYINDYPMTIQYSEIKSGIDRELEVSNQPTQPFDMQKLMLHVYKALDLTDSLFGWGTNKLTDIDSRIIHYTQEGNWCRLLMARDAMIPDSADDQLIHSIDTLQTGGLSMTLNSLLDHMFTNAKEDEDIIEMRYKQAWTNLEWGKLQAPARMDSSLRQQESLYLAVKSLSTGPEKSEVSQLIQHMLQSCENSLQQAHTPDQLKQCLYQLEKVELLKQMCQAFNTSQTGLEYLISEWRSVMPDKNSVINPLDSERIQENLTIQSSLLKSSASSKALKDYIIEATVLYSTVSRQSNLLMVSESIMSKLHRIYPELWTSMCDMEQAHIYWEHKETERAMFLMKNCIANLDVKTVEDAALQSQACRMLGQWITDTKLENANDIMDKYLLPAVGAAEKSHGYYEKEASYHTVASFCDAEYERLGAYMKSTEYIEKVAVAKVQQEIQASGAVAAQTLYGSRLSTYRNMNEESIRLVQKGYLDNMLQALQYHSLTLKYGIQYDLVSVFRIIAIWFDNEANYSEIREFARTKLPGDIPSYKFLPLVQQLAARLSTEDCDLQVTLKNIMTSLAKDHPHHVVPALLALRNATIDSKTSETKLRAEAAIKILCNINSKALVKDYMAVTEALIELANHPMKEHSSNSRLDRKLKISSISDLSNIPILTYPIKVNQGGDYSSIPTIRKYDSRCDFAGGLNCPKIVWCHGSDGKQYKQLCKGKDDSRQDAVMQQVFTVVNQLLAADNNTKSLKIRTYKIIPLSHTSGVLEWCEGTLPLGVWLVGPHPNYKQGAHYRYHPSSQYHSLRCQQLLHRAGDKKKADGGEILDRTYEEICANLPPVLRHFFFEFFPQPSDWFDARINYSRSVAVNAIVGYILGIGDRHSNNMLLDKKTGELVHIDFGVSFEIGKTLRVPEGVPFRLTRDIVDGLGPTGVDGLFKRSCEKTMALLRTSSTIIMTLLQVLRHDPLHNWTLSEEKLAKIQRVDIKTELDSSSASVFGSQASTGFVNPARPSKEDQKHQQAHTVLLAVQHKLQGFEQNSHLSVNGQVNLLIQQAMDPKILSRMFAGWQPYL